MTVWPVLCHGMRYYSDLTMELPFTLTHPEPEHKVICGMVTLPRRKSTITQDDQQTQAGATGGQVTDTTTSGNPEQPHTTLQSLVIVFDR